MNFHKVLNHFFFFGHTKVLIVDVHNNIPVYDMAFWQCGKGYDSFVVCEISCWVVGGGGFGQCGKR